MNLDDLLKNVREGLPVSPQDAARHKKKISTEKFFNLAQELRTEGTINGQQVTPAERKEGFKKSKNPIEFKKFVEKVLAKKSGGGGGGGSVSISGTPSQKLLPGSISTSAADADLDPGEGGDKPKRKKTLLTFVKQINNRVGGILRILDKRADVEEDAAQERGQETEKARRLKKESDNEGKKKNKLGLPGPIAKMAAPVTSLWDNIIKTIGRLIIGWGLVKFLKWLQDPKNKKAVEDFKEFITVAVPAILKGILAVIGFNLVKTLVKFTAGIVMGAGKLILFLGKFAMNIARWGQKNPKMAIALGVGALAGLAISALKGDKEKGEQEEGTEITTEETQAIQLEEAAGGGEQQSPPPVQKFEGGGFVTNVLNNIVSGAQASMYQGGGNVQQIASPKVEVNAMPEPEGTDTVPAMLTPGEFVMSRGAVQKWGRGTLEGMNKAGGGTNKPKISKKSPMIYAAGGGSIPDGWSTSKTVKQPNMWERFKSASGNVVRGLMGKAKDAQQLLSSPPGSGGKGTIVPLPIPKSSGGATASGADSSMVSSGEPIFSPIDKNNLSTLVTKSMYSILE